MCAASALSGSASAARRARSSASAKNPWRRFCSARMSAWPGLSCCAGVASAAVACTASISMIAAARAARRSPAALNGISLAASPCATALSSVATRAITSGQSSPQLWRNSRMVGYHGLSSRLSIQRQSVTDGSNNHTGLPSAPARCATDVSTVITRSSALTAPADSAKSPKAGARSSIAYLPRWSVLRSAALEPTCKLANEVPRTSKSGESDCRSIERR